MRDLTSGESVIFSCLKFPEKFVGPHDLLLNGYRVFIFDHLPASKHLCSHVVDKGKYAFLINKYSQRIWTLKN